MSSETGTARGVKGYPAAMQRLWLITNPASGSTSDAVLKEYDELLVTLGCVEAGRTIFPGAALPDAKTLAAANADTLVIFGGDGTINAATAIADDWDGVCLVLPGGTMNMFAKSLHGDAAWDDILTAAAQAPKQRMPLAVAGEARAISGVIAGPVSAWVHARERVRSGAWGGVRRALSFAWRKSFVRSVRIVGDPVHTGRRRAIFIAPLEDALEVASVGMISGLSAAILGGKWLLGNWRDDPDITVSRCQTLTLSANLTVSALFDGEPVKLRSPAMINFSQTRLQFLKTLAAVPKV